jgi:hypothetical protein
MNHSPEESEFTYHPFSDEAMEALDRGISLADQGLDLDSEEIEKVLENFSDEEKEAIKIFIGYSQSIKNLPLPEMKKVAKEAGKQKMLKRLEELRKRDGQSS